MKTRKARTTKGGHPIQIRLFAGFSDLLKFIETTPVDEGWNTDCMTREMDKSFYGVTTFQEAKTGLTTGKNVTEIKKAIPKGTTKRTTKKRGLDVIGGCPNVPAYLSGSPACMYRMRTEKTKGAYNVFVDMSANCGITKKQIREAGIEILIKVLQLSNKYPVNLYAGDTGEYNNHIQINATKIVDAGKPFNVARVSFALTEPAFLRVFSFGCIERTGGFWSKSAQYGYGRPVYDKALRSDALSQVFKNTIVVSLQDVIYKDRHAFDEVDKALKER